MQRWGFLKTLIRQASLQSTNNLRNLGTNLVYTVSRKIHIAPTPTVSEYIRHALTESKYKNLRSAASKQFGSYNQNLSLLEMEIQDYYLSSPDLPSKRGKLVGDDWNRYPQLAVDCRLLRKGTYTLTSRGQLFLGLVSEEERRAFDINEPELLGRTNPFYLSIPQKLLLLFSLVDADGNLLQKLYRILLDYSDSFSAPEAGNFLPDIYRKMAQEYRGRIRSGDDYIRIQRLKDTANTIEAVKLHPNPGGKNSREHAITPRLELFVDIGILSKPDSFTYSYQIIDATRVFFEPLCVSESIEDFLNRRFFDVANRSLNLNGAHKVDSNHIIPMLQKAYNVLKSPVGYSPILELCLLAGIFSLDQVGIFFEISEAIEILKSLQKEWPHSVTFNVDRWGMLNFVKFSNDLT